MSENLPIQISPNKIKNIVAFKLNNGSKLKLLTPETMKLLGSVKRLANIAKGKGRENVPKLESVELVLVHCNVVKIDYKHPSKILSTFVPNKQFGQLINISPHSLAMINAITTKFPFDKVWFSDQVSKAFEIEDNVNLTIIIA